MTKYPAAPSGSLAVVRQQAAEIDKDMAQEIRQCAPIEPGSIKDTVVERKKVVQPKLTGVAAVASSAHGVAATQGHWWRLRPRDASGLHYCWDACPAFRTNCA